MRPVPTRKIVSKIKASKVTHTVPTSTTGVSTEFEAVSTSSPMPDWAPWNSAATITPQHSAAATRSAATSCGKIAGSTTVR